MAQTANRVIILGKVFEIGEEVPEVGSLRLDQEWNIVGDIADENKLANVTWLKDGTNALLYDGNGTNKVLISKGGIWKGLN